MKKLFPVLLLLLATPASACVFCNREVRDGIYNSALLPNLASMLSAFIVLAIIVALLSYFDTKQHARQSMFNPDVHALNPVPLTTAAMVLGIGLGGFADGIVLHQILQWHEMLSNKIPGTNYVGKSINMFWDGIFHGFCLIVTIIGICLLWKLMKRSGIDKGGRLLVGGMLLGWGVFNIVEGIIDHHILKLHNVVEASANHDLANYGFLIFSLILILVGYVFCRRRSHDSDSGAR